MICEKEKTNSKSLAAIIVTNRVLGLYNDEVKYCISELQRREDAGDLFDYESYIDENIKIIEKQKNESIKNTDLFSLLTSIGKI